MSVVKINAIDVPEGAGAELERRFAAQQGSVQDQPGFEEFMLLRPTAGESRYFVVTRWASQEAFEAWRDGEAFKRSHGSAGQSGHGHGHGHADGAGGEARRPVGTGAALLEFEVVDFTN